MFKMNYIKYIPRFGRNNVQKQHMISGKIFHYMKQQFQFFSSATNGLPQITEDDDVWRKIIYNEILTKVEENQPPRKHTKDRPIFLKYFVEGDNKVDENTSTNEVENNPESLNFPFEIKKQFLKETEKKSQLETKLPQSVYNFSYSDDKKIKELINSAHNIKLNIRNMENPEKWASNYYGEVENSDPGEKFIFGTCNPNKRVSTVPCGGCGAFLQCNSPSIPGFIPAEIFEERTKTELQSEICQRCLFLKRFDVSLGVSVSPLEYIQILSSIKEKEALVILMVDLLDFPCSIFPGILDIIGPAKPVVIVGNKVDLLIQDGKDSLKNFKYSLLNELKKQGVNLQNVEYVSLISAKTGYGIEELIDQLFLIAKGDIYLIGCTNAGKSSLFNALIQSDFCKVKAVNLLQRATVSAWPGTTMNLLKFPIMKPTKSRLYARSLRLEYQTKEERALRVYNWLRQDIKMEQIPLQGYVGTTFLKEPEREDITKDYDSLGDLKREGLNPKTHDFLRSKWFYDTPGVVHEDQLVNLLTTPELLLTVPKNMLLPRNFHVKPGTSLFIGGLARLDYISGPNFVWFTVFASMELPITVTKLEDADYVYKKLLGSPFFRVPMEGKDRLSKWPNLSSKKLEIVGKLPKAAFKQAIHDDETITETSADVVLSSAGWVAVTVPLSFISRVEAWTPEGKGIYLRDCPLIKRGVLFRGRKIPRAPAYRVSVKEVKGYSLAEEPPPL